MRRYYAIMRQFMREQNYVRLCGIVRDYAHIIVTSLISNVVHQLVHPFFKIKDLSASCTFVQLNSRPVARYSRARPSSNDEPRKISIRQSNFGFDVNFDGEIKIEGGIKSKE